MKTALLELFKDRKLVDRSSMQEDDYAYRSDMQVEIIGALLMNTNTPDDEALAGYDLRVVLYAEEDRVVSDELYTLTGWLDDSPPLDRAELSIVAFMGWTNDS